jgi:hypothetical protein
MSLARFSFGVMEVGEAPMQHHHHGCRSQGFAESELGALLAVIEQQL